MLIYPSPKPLDPEDISSPCPNYTFRIKVSSLIDVCFSAFSSIIPPHCIVFYLRYVF